MLKIVFVFIFTLHLFASQLELSLSSNPSRINPILATDSASSEIADWVFSGLFKYDKDGNIIPDLAQSYSFENDTTLIIKLKKNITWHDGEKFTAQDVKFTYDTILSPKVFTPTKTSFLKVQNVEVLDQYTLKIIYKEPYFKALHIWMTGILPKHILQNEKDLMTSDFNKNPIGTGSYKLKTFKPSQDIILSANKNYHDEVPKIDTIRYKFIPDPNTTFAMLGQKKLDLGGLSPLQIDRQLPNNFRQNYSIYEKPSFSYTYMGFNLKHDKFKDIKIRQAIDLAINKKEIIDILFFSHGQIAYGPFLPGSNAYNPNIKSSYNPKKAKELLNSLGYDENNRFSFTVVTNANNSIRVNATQIIQYQLAKIGIDMKIKVMEWQAFLNTVVLPKKFEAVILGWGLSLQADARSIWHSKSYQKGGFNFVGYSNKEVDSLIELAETTTDEKEFGKIYQEIFAHIAQDYPYIFLYVPNSITVVNKSIKNVSSSLIGVMHNQNQWIKE